MQILGIDIGGSGIKAAVVETQTGELVSERHRIPTPKPAKPEAVAATVKEMLEFFNWKSTVGVSFPTVIVEGKSLTQGNIEPEWKDCQADELFEETCGQKFFILNDADAAGMAEMTFGAGKDQKGTVITVTIGTGLGSGVFRDGRLVPNIELGRILGKNGKPIEFWAADSARKREELSLKKWAKRFDFFLNHVVRTMRPNLFIIGGGLSKKMDKFKEHLTCEVPVVVAEFKNNAGIIGAAMFAEQSMNR